MPSTLPIVYLARHGETAWSISGQHTGLSDIPLTPRGEQNACQLGERLKGMVFGRVFCSPLVRARKTCELSGFGNRAEIDPDLVEWNYGEYEGRTTADVRRERPDWLLFRDGCPGGESVAEVTARADRVVTRLKSISTDIVVYSSGHFLRVVAARWLGREAAMGRCLFLGTATLSAVGYEHSQSNPVIRLWNDDRHVVK
jgi:broad specificity phosphatase PhoE